MSTTQIPSPRYRNFELEVRARRAEAVMEMLAAGWQRLKRLMIVPPASRGEEALQIRRAWLKASA
jgi:hypothetical protein